MPQTIQDRIILKNVVIAIDKFKHLVFSEKYLVSI